MRTTEGSTLRTSIEGGTLYIRATGVVNLDAMRRVRAEMARQAFRAEVRRVLVDLSGGLLLMTPAGWQTFSEESSPRHVLHLPFALLVDATAIDAAWAFCDYMNAHGRISLAFSSAPEAQWWAQGSPERRLKARTSSEAGTPPYRRGQRPPL